ncbi:MAG: penicillin-binding transpeptidase domain-containing protein, partial [Patescibacteria group bacterium]
YNSLEKSIKNLGAKKGAAVALDPRNGAVLAMVSYPAYDNNIFSGRILQEDFNNLQNDPYQPFFNRAISAQYPTGSTIKPFLASAALQENIISPNKIINDPGYILVKNQYDPSITYKFGGVIPHGPVDMREAIAVSSNIYFYTIGGGYENQQGLGPTRIKKYLDLFGWEEKTGIDLPGEFSGFVPSPEWKQEYKNEGWWDGDTYNLSIGQSDLQVTPLQVALAYSAIANGGTLYKPQVAKSIAEGSGKDAKIIEEFHPQVIRQNFISPENISIVRQGMRDCVQKPYGSCVVLNNLPVAVAGKTGTAETNKEGFFNTWSSNFAPYDNPEIVFVATIESVEGLRAATLPVAHEVLQYYFSKK